MSFIRNLYLASLVVLMSFNAACATEQPAAQNQAKEQPTTVIAQVAIESPTAKKPTSKVEEYDWGKLRWGMTRDEVKRAYSDTSFPIKQFGTSKKLYEETYTTALYFEENSLIGVAIKLPLSEGIGAVGRVIENFPDRQQIDETPFLVSGDGRSIMLQGSTENFIFIAVTADFFSKQFDPKIFDLFVSYMGYVDMRLTIVEGKFNRSDKRGKTSPEHDLRCDELRENLVELQRKKADNERKCADWERSVDFHTRRFSLCPYLDIELTQKVRKFENLYNENCR